MLRNFTKSIFIYGLAPSFGKFIGIFLIPIYTRVFNPSEYGVIDLFNVIIYLLVIFANLEIHSGMGRYFNLTKVTKERQVLVSTAFWNEIILSFVVILFASIFSKNINSRLLHTLEYNNVFLIALLWLPVSCIFTYLSVVMRYEKRASLFLIVALIQIIVKVSVSLVTILVLKWGVAGIFIGQIAGDLIGSLLLLYFLKRYIIFAYDINILRKLITFSLPLIPGVIVFYFNQSLNRLVMLKYLSLEAIGLYAIALKVSSIFVLIMSAFRMAWEPFMYENLERDDQKKIFICIYKLAIISLSGLVISITLFSKEILMVLTSEKYFSAYPLIGFLSIFTVLTILRLIVGIGPKITKKTFYDSFASITGVVVNVVAMFIFIPKFGIMGAGYGLCLGGLVTFVLNWYFTSKLYLINYPKVLTIALVFLSFFVAFFNIKYCMSFTLKAIFVIGLLLSSLFYYRGRIHKIYSNLVFNRYKR
ncbi:hypothetical protein D4R71_04505 [bacterium]|nr:MAG: hypothetical protein D4R71_04505 [bacterium]